MINTFGEKHPSDSKFVADCRLLQSMYSAEVGEKIRPYMGSDVVVHYYGNYIAGGEVSGASPFGRKRSRLLDESCQYFLINPIPNHHVLSTVIIWLFSGSF